MADFTAVGKYLSVGADASPDAVTGFDVVVLVAAERQHTGESYDVPVIRCPLPDSEEKEPNTAVIAKAQACAEKVAWLIAPFSFPWSKELAVGLRGYLPSGDEIVTAPKRVLVTCLAGENRSLLVAGMALVLSGEQPDGKTAREYLQALRGPRAFLNPGMDVALDRFYPKELEMYRPRPSKTQVSSKGIIIR